MGHPSGDGPGAEPCPTPGGRDARGRRGRAQPKPAVLFFAQRHGLTLPGQDGGGVGGSVLGLLCMVLGLLVCPRTKKGEWLRDGASGPGNESPGGP